MRLKCMLRSLTRDDALAIMHYLFGRTENGCDYMVFYADETMSKLYGDRKYTGGKDGHTANWPGTGGRPPLEIDANHFFFQWQTDGSVSRFFFCFGPFWVASIIEELRYNSVTRKFNRQARCSNMQKGDHQLYNTPSPCCQGKVIG